MAYPQLHQKLYTPMLSQTRTCIKTYANSRLVLDLFDNVSQLRKSGTYDILRTGL